MGDLQDTQTEHEHHADFLSKGHLQMVELPQRQDHRDNVKNHIQASRRPALSIFIVTGIVMSPIPAKPRALDRAALKNRDNHKSDEIGDVQSNHNVCCNAKTPSREYP